MQIITANVKIRIKFKVEDKITLDEIRENVKQYINEKNYLIRNVSFKTVELEKWLKIIISVNNKYWKSLES